MILRPKNYCYITWVRSRLEYATVLWSTHTQRNWISQVWREYRILDTDYSGYERLSRLNLLPLQYRREINDIIFFFKCFRNICLVDIFDYVSFRSCGKPLRNVDHLTLKIPFSRTESFKNSYFVRICRLWNDLPLVIRESDTLPIFRNKLLVFYRNKFYATFLPCKKTSFKTF